MNATMTGTKPSRPLPTIVWRSEAESAMWHRFTPAQRVKPAVGKLMIGDKDWPPIWSDPWQERP